MVNLFQLRHRPFAHVGAVGGRIRPQRQKFLDFPQRKTDLLGLADETDALYRLLRVEPETSVERFRRLFDQALALIEPYGLDADPAFLAALLIVNSVIIFDSMIKFCTTYYSTE